MLNNHLSIFKDAVLGVQRDVSMVARLDAADDLGIDVEALGNLDDLLSLRGWEINLWRS